MRKIVLFFLIFVLSIVPIGCSKNTIKEPPEISVIVADKEIEYITAKNKWNGDIFDREDTFITILKEQKEIPAFEEGSKVEIVFKNNPPEKFNVYDILIDENGKQIYTDKEINEIPIELNNGKCTFNINKHIASLLSSKYEPDKKDIRGFRMIASWGENECEYAFVIKTYSKNEPVINEIDRSEYLTGEIITEGNYRIIEDIGQNYITFIPDKESLEIIKSKYGEKERYELVYDNLKKVDGLPDELGIYKVKVKIAQVDNYGYLVIEDIMMTDEIGTILYEGKTYEGNDLDDTVEVKDRIGGLIVDYVRKDNGGIIVGFAGEIESEGYYYIDPNEYSMYGPTGVIHMDEDNLSKFPTIYGERTYNTIWFSKTNELFDELKNNSLFGKGRFKTSGYLLIYNIGMGWGPAGILNEIVSLDENYKNLIPAEGGKAVGYSGMADNFVIINHTLYDENFSLKEREYYYINKNNPEKIIIPVEFKYYYILKEAINDNEFILQTEGYDESIETSNEFNPHEIKCTITPNGIVTERIN